MKCEACGDNEATVHFKQVTDGMSREMHLCESCASETDFNITSEPSVSDLLFGPCAQCGKPPGGEDRECPVCRMKESDFRRLSRFGCSACYETFSAELMPVLKAMHRSTLHTGKVPATERIGAEIAELEHAMEKAVTAQDFEGAALLRDRISGLKTNTREARASE